MNHAGSNIGNANIGGGGGGGGSEVKELRVKIDVSYHLKLHALKLLRNKKMSDAVQEALDYYFEHVVRSDELAHEAELAERK